MANGDAVRNVEFTVRYAIREWLIDDVELQYDWIDDAGRESDELFPSVESAEDDIRDRHP